ncbi:MAG TPA: amino acid adenylation domain-containing protein, partial [Vicinamibacteria bacterium]
AEDRAAALRRLMAEEARLPFDLARGHLFRARLLRLADEDHVLLATLHHIVADGWSLGVLVRELGALYTAFSRNEPSPLPHLPVQYADFAQWQRQWLSGERLQRQLAYWREKLAGLPTLNLPLDRPRPPLQTFRGAMHHFRIPGDVAARVRELARREKATIFMALMTAFQTLLHRYSDQEDVAVGTPVAGRTRTELEGLIGLFANTLVFRTDLGGDPSFREALARVRENALEAYAHQEMPFERLVGELRPERNLSAHPLFQVMFVLQNAPAAPVRLPGLGLGSVGVETGTSRFDLTLFVTDGADGFSGTFEYNTDLFDRETVERLSAHFGMLLEGAIEAPDRRISELPLLTSPERTRMIGEWNDTARDVPPEACLHGLIEAQVARSPDRIAVSFEGESLSYRALDKRANQLAHRLRKLGIGPEVLVGIYLERSLDMVVALLATLKAGGAYLPLDPAYPQDRLAFMAADAGIHVLMTQASLLDMLPRGGAEVLCLDSERESLARESETALPELVSGDNLAYVLYTSGSTGRPKGVQIPHGAVVNFLTAMTEQPGLGPEDVLLSVTTLSFDIAGLELYLPLVMGARVELVGRETAADGRQLRERLDRSGTTVMQATPATWRLLLEAGWNGEAPLKVLCGGEALPGDLAAELLRRGASVWNLYGPTETTIWSALHRVVAAEPVAPLGRPIANTEMYVLDGRGQPVPVGVPGELFIGGAGVARGYRNRADLTAERFVPNPFASAPGARLYRTGDLVRYRPDGTIDFLGRLDNQMKVRGFRIELGEIEAALMDHEAVASAAVVARKNGAGDRQLSAHVVFGRGRDATVTELRADLKKKLPAHMIPSSFLVLDALPMTPNGKVDRKALARLEDRQDERVPARGPRTATERLVAEAWREALGLARVSVQDNFFDIGGHSLLSMRVLARLEKSLGLRLNPREMIFQTLEQFAAMCEERLGKGQQDAVSL